MQSELWGGVLDVHTATAAWAFVCIETKAGGREEKGPRDRAPPEGAAATQGYHSWQSGKSCPVETGCEDPGEAWWGLS